MADKIRLAWWNTGLVPRRGQVERTDDYKRTVLEVVADLFASGGADAVALAEITEAEIELIQAAMDNPVRSYFDKEDKTGLAMLYKDDSMGVINSKILVDRYSDKVMRRGCQLTILLTDNTFEFCLFLCHWPSRM